MPTVWTVQQVTPELAAVWLAIPGQRRRLNRRKVDLLAAWMRAGAPIDWPRRLAPITFGKQGQVLDGQHRLAACVETGCGFTALISRAADVDQSTAHVASEPARIRRLGWLLARNRARSR